MKMMTEVTVHCAAVSNRTTFVEEFVLQETARQQQCITFMAETR